MNKPKILYIDDEIENLQSFRFLFKKEFEISISQSPLEALEMIKDEDFSLILSDSRMPGMNGVELLTKAKALKPQIPRILVTGYTDYDSILEAINQARIVQCVHKPYEAKDMREVLWSCSLKQNSFSISNQVNLSESLVIMLLDEKEEIHFVNKNMERLMQEKGQNLVGENFHKHFSLISNFQQNETYSFLNTEINFYFLSESFEYNLKNKKILYGYYKK